MPTTAGDKLLYTLTKPCKKKKKTHVRLVSKLSAIYNKAKLTCAIELELRHSSFRSKPDHMNRANGRVSKCMSFLKESSEARQRLWFQTAQCGATRTSERKMT